MYILAYPNTYTYYYTYIYYMYIFYLYIYIYRAREVTHTCIYEVHGSSKDSSGVSFALSTAWDSMTAL